MMRLLLICLLLIASDALYAQGWQRYYEGDRLLGLQILPDGSLVAAGNATDSLGRTLGYWQHTDAYGQPLFVQNIGNAIYNESAQVLIGKEGQEWLLFGNRSDDSIQTRVLYPNGQVKNTIQTGLRGVLYKGQKTSDGGAIVVGSQSTTQNNLSNSLCVRTDADGTVLWSKTDSIGTSTIATDALEALDGSIWVAGGIVRTVATPNADFFVQKRTTAGALLWTKTCNLPDNEYVSSIVSKSVGVQIVVGSVASAIDSLSFDEDIWLVALDAAGDTLWTRRHPISGIQRTQQAVLLSDGRIAIVGETRPTQNGSRDAFLALTDSAGVLLWFKTYGGLKGDIFWDVQPTTDGGFALAGQTASVGDGSLQAWLVRTDSAGAVWNNRVKGRVARDVVKNCIVENGEEGLVNWLISAAGTSGTWFTQTDAFGSYEIALDTGIWYISVLPLSGYWAPCTDSLPLLFTGSSDTIVIDWPIQAVYDCPLLRVDLSTPFLRRCFENTYQVRYTNYGTALANDARVAIVPDRYLTPTGSSLPYTEVGDTLLFEVGDVAPFEGGGFTWTALLDCDSTVLGQAHCSSAHITPDSLCTDFNPIWDGASLEVSGYCAGDSVVMTITNVGIGGMQNAVEYLIIEDQIIFKPTLLQLAAGASTQIVVYPNGATVTLLVSQTPGHPGNSHPTLVIEGCGGFPFSTGYAFQFPTDDGDPFTDIDCQPNIGSFDPNDKTAMPLGVDATQHYIEAGETIEYLIRFQNTGTDTAFRVEIRDTLPRGLDLSKFESGASSHPYRLYIEGAGVLRFVFDPIALPDSAANLAGSQGFVKYRIPSEKTLAAGTTLRNRAAIYFDFNAPILTEPTLHTIGHPLEYLTSSTVEKGQNADLNQLDISPNPCTSSAHIRWRPTHPAMNYRVQVIDVLGRLIVESQTSNHEIDLSTIALPASVLMIRVIQSDQIIATGKLIKI